MPKPMLVDAELLRSLLFLASDAEQARARRLRVDAKRAKRPEVRYYAERDALLADARAAEYAWLLAGVQAAFDAERAAEEAARDAQRRRERALRDAEIRALLKDLAF